MRSPGDRVAIVALQSLHYIVAFLGVLQAGLIAVPLPAPQFGIHDERISSALRDCSPAVILTTLSAIDEVSKICIAGTRQRHDRPAPVRVWRWTRWTWTPREISMRLGMRLRTRHICSTPQGSTRQPAGVVVSHRIVITNCGQLMSDYFEDTEQVPSTSVSWLPFYHDMGLLRALSCRWSTKTPQCCLVRWLFWNGQPAGCNCWANISGPVSSAPNFGFELAVRRTSDDDMAGLDLGTCGRSSLVPNV